MRREREVSEGAFKKGRRGGLGPRTSRVRPLSHFLIVGGGEGDRGQQGISSGCSRRRISGEKGSCGIRNICHPLKEIRKG